MGISSDRQFLGLVGYRLPGWFPRLPSQSQYNRRLRSLVELISIVQQRLARWLDAGGVRLADGTTVSEDVKAVLGTVDNPMTRDQVVAKCRSLMTPIVGAASSTKLIDSILSIDQVASVRTLRPLLQRS